MRELDGGVLLDLPGLGRVTADIAWGGNYFGIIDIREKALKIGPETGASCPK